MHGAHIARHPQKLKRPPLHIYPVDDPYHKPSSCFKWFWKSDLLIKIHFPLCLCSPLWRLGSSSVVYCYTALCTPSLRPDMWPTPSGNSLPAVYPPNKLAPAPAPTAYTLLSLHACLHLHSTLYLWRVLGTLDLAARRRRRRCSADAGPGRAKDTADWGNIKSERKLTENQFPRNTLQCLVSASSAPLIPTNKI